MEAFLAAESSYSVMDVIFFIDHQLAMYEWNDDKLYPRMMALKEKNPKLKISLAVGGWNHENGSPSMIFTHNSYIGSIL